VAPVAERIRFHRHDLEPVTAVMTRLTAAQRGWMNFHPDVNEDGPAEPAPLLGFLSARGPSVPLCTWVPETSRRERRIPPQLGVQHGTGPRVAARLDTLGLPVPTGWRVSQDHPRRGLVVEVIPDEPLPVLAGWVLDAGDALSLVRVTGWWTAAVYAEKA
jgi:hypothetical protein